MVLVFGNTTDVHGPIFQPEPNTRGTWDILTTCIITIALCAWTALHLNVPEHKKTKFQRLRKAKWLVLGLVAPEVVAYVAWRQRKGAKKVLKDVRVHLGQKAPVSKLKRALRWCMRIVPGNFSHSLESATTSTVAARIHRPTWTLVHGFYAIMGGFSLDSSSSATPFLPGDHTRAALTSEGVRFLLQHEPESLPNISKEDIEDKSKADGLKKTLVCAQAVWFGVSCITRLAQHLPISLLELNAFGHAACALLIYWMWWHKPLDVDEPTLIEGEKLKPLFAYMWMSSRVGAEGMKAYDMHGRLKDEFDALWCYQNPKIGDLVFNGASGIAHPQTSGEGEKPLPEVPQAGNFGLDGVLYNTINRQYVEGELRFQVKQWLLSTRVAARLGRKRPPGLGVRRTAVGHVSTIDIERWKLAHEAIERYNLEVDLHSRHNGRSQMYDEDPRLKLRIPNHASLLGSKPSEVWLGFAVAGFLYGGLHLLAWDAPFSSRAEQILWRLAAASVTLTPLFAGPVIVAYPTVSKTVLDVVRRFQGQKAENEKGPVIWMKGILSMMIMIVMMISPLLWFLYILGRVYLVVECFKNVAHLPQGAFEDVSWPAYLPHIN